MIAAVEIKDMSLNLIKVNIKRRTPSEPVRFPPTDWGWRNDQGSNKEVPIISLSYGGVSAGFVVSMSVSSAGPSSNSVEISTQCDL